MLNTVGGWVGGWGNTCFLHLEFLTILGQHVSREHRSYGQGAGVYFVCEGHAAAYDYIN